MSEQTFFLLFFIVSTISATCFVVFGGDWHDGRHKQRPVVVGLYERGRAVHAVVLTCYECGKSQVFADRTSERLLLLMTWTKDETGWRHWRCER